MTTQPTAAQVLPKDELDYLRKRLHSQLVGAQWSIGECWAVIHHIDALELSLTARDRQYASAVETLVDIAAMGKKAGSESAKHRLTELGIEWSTGELKADYGSMT
jgi:hypothetical protein